MELQTQIITSSNLWGVIQPIKTFICFVVLSCAFFCLAACGLCSTNEMQNPPEEYDACESFGKSYNLGFPDLIVGDTSPGYGSPTIHNHNSFESMCPDNHSFCFPSTLSGFNHKRNLKSTFVGDSASICFVFFPRCLGLLSAELILQKSSGGFIVEAKGYASESPFGIQPLLGLEISAGGRLSKNFALSNPFDETLYVEEITATISVSLGHTSVETDTTCGVNNFQVFDNFFPIIKNLLVVKSSQTGSPVVAIKPHRNWEIPPYSSETLMDRDITVGLEGKLSGALCLHLTRYSRDKSETIVVPIEAEMDRYFGDDIAGMFVSAMLEGLASCQGGESVITISLRNYGPYVLSFVKAVQVADTEFFHTKCMDGLLLFPGTVRQVSIIYRNYLHIDLQDMPTKVSNLRESCKLVILTNDSTNPQIEILCEDILHICFEHQRGSSVGEEEKSKLIKSGYTGVGFEVRNKRPPPNVKVIETADVDELVLRNWMSEGTTDGMPVLEDHKVLFPMVQVGSYVSRWITVKNPRQHPVMVQLILNSGEIIGECRGPDDLLCPSSSSLVLDEAATPTKYGFSVADSAVTEAYLHPYDNLTLGPIIFYPPKPCGWSVSALIRNNLSGVEWLPLSGFGGLLSLGLLERSEYVHSINFDFKIPKPLNFSFPYAFFHMKEMTTACSEPLVKELYVKNTGDLPLEVKSVRVSGRECGLDGFKIHACRGFAHLPGESTKLLISYQTHFSAAMVHRDLEFALATGIFLIPMKASFPYDVRSNCKKSIFWMLVKKWFLGLLLVASLILLVFCFIFPQTVSLGSLDYSSKSDNHSIHTTIEPAGKFPLLPCNQRRSKLSMSGKMNDLFCSVQKDTTSTMRVSPCSRYSYGQGEPSEQELSQHLIQTSENHKQNCHLLDTPDEKKSPLTAVQSSNTTKASSLPGSLMVKTGKEKSRSRRRKRKSLGAKLAPFSEVSSSQSGNSTPSSPLSPTLSSNSNWWLSPDVEKPSLEAHRLITQVPAQHLYYYQASSSMAKTNLLEPKVPVKFISNNKVSSPRLPRSVSTSSATIPVKISSATCPLPDKRSTFSSVQTSTVNVVAQAPRSINENQKVVVGAPKVGVADEYAYDIWGDHLSWIHLLVPKNVTCMKSIPAEMNFDSFFVEGPLTLMANSQAH